MVIDKPRCRFCGEATKRYVSSGKDKLYCNRLCKAKHQRRITPKRTIPNRIGQCIECGKEIRIPANNPHKQFCSKACSDRVHGREKRARKRYAQPSLNRMTLSEIAKRDRWICQICGKRVRQDVTQRRLRASLDHVIPLIRGGTNESTNLQLAHFGCNSKKCDKILTLF